MKPLVAILSLLPVIALAQSNPAAQAAKPWRQQHERTIVEELMTLLANCAVADGISRYVLRGESFLEGASGCVSASTIVRRVGISHLRTVLRAERKAF